MKRAPLAVVLAVALVGCGSTNPGTATIASAAEVPTWLGSQGLSAATAQLLAKLQADARHQAAAVCVSPNAVDALEDDYRASLRAPFVRAAVLRAASTARGCGLQAQAARLKQITAS